ncbi:MAG: hypothetical protein ACJZ5B_04840 [Candidatus Poseidoniaceae archaeon]
MGRVANYDFKLLDTSKIQLELTWAIHEFDRSALGLNLDLTADGIDAEDGAPADLIRNNFDISPARTWYNYS